MSIITKIPYPPCDHNHLPSPGLQQWPTTLVGHRQGPRRPFLAHTCGWQGHVGPCLWSTIAKALVTLADPFGNIKKRKKRKDIKNILKNLENLNNYEDRQIAVLVIFGQNQLKGLHWIIVKIS